MASIDEIPREADWDAAPNLLDASAINVEMTPQRCNFDYWVSAAPQGTWIGLVNGHTAEARVPPHMLEDGPLRTAALQEFGFRAVSEEKAVRALGLVVPIAPDIDSMEFVVTQLVDETRHANVFRNHLVELGVARDDLQRTIEGLVGADCARVLDPLEEYALPVCRDEKDFICTMVFLTILIEGVLSPSAELSERKWRALDPPAAEIDRGANIDEIRHLNVGAAIVREQLLEHPDEKPRILEFITEGRELWDRLPIVDVLYRRECLYQQGLEEHAHLVGNYEIEEGRRLVDTTPDDRLELALAWASEVQEGRLRYMGLEEAI